jgi:mannobiose 2-epimerase
MRLSEKDRNDAKTMNTHLHILEGYTGLYRVWKDETLRRRLVELCEIFMNKIVRPDGHLGLFFDEDWRSQSDMVSFGHDIEASWLLCETAELLEDEALLRRVHECCGRIATASLEGLQPDGSMIYEGTPPASFDTDRHWWVQAETVVGCLNQGWTDRAIHCWEYIKSNLISPDGEWYWSVDAEGHPNTRDDRAGFWKCPYHNGRMCLEILTTYSRG